MSDIQRVGVVGSGLMGSGIAEVSARAGLDVIVAEVNVDASAAAQGRIASSLARGVKSGKLSEADGMVDGIRGATHHQPRHVGDRDTTARRHRDRQLRDRPRLIDH